MYLLLLLLNIPYFNYNKTSSFHLAIYRQHYNNHGAQGNLMWGKLNWTRQGTGAGLRREERERLTGASWDV